MRQSQTYRRGKHNDVEVDPNKYETYRNGVAFRILRRNRGRMTPYDAWQLAAIPAFFLWLFRGPVHYFKKKKVDRAIRKKLARSNKHSH